MARVSDKETKADVGAPEPAHDEDGSALPPPVREHLARELRAAYHGLAEKPAFLGDPALPPALEDHVRRIETRERVIHDRGIAAVEKALGEAGSEGAGSAGSAPGRGKPRKG